MPRKFECEICGGKFDKSIKLKEHLLIHTGEIPHSCDICGKGFQKVAQFKRHVIGHSTQ